MADGDCLLCNTEQIMIVRRATFQSRRFIVTRCGSLFAVNVYGGRTEFVGGRQNPWVYPYRACLASLNGSRAVGGGGVRAVVRTKCVDRTTLQKACKRPAEGTRNSRCSRKQLAEICFNSLTAPSWPIAARAPANNATLAAPVACISVGSVHCRLWGVAGRPCL